MENTQKKYEPVDEISSIQYVLYNSPYGAMQSMINDLSVLKQFPVEDEKYQAPIRENLEMHCEILTMKNSEEKVIAFNKALGSGENGHYYENHFTGKRYSYKNQEICSVEDLPQGEVKQQDMVTKLGQCLKIYLDEFFGNARDFNIIGNDNSIDFVYTAKTKNQNNFYNGYWLGVWSFSGNMLKGRVDNRCHIFESGNVHFHEYKEHEEKIAGADVNAKCQALVHEIMNVEKKIGVR